LFADIKQAMTAFLDKTLSIESFASFSEHRLLCTRLFFDPSKKITFYDVLLYVPETLLLQHEGDAQLATR